MNQTIKLLIYIVLTIVGISLINTFVGGLLGEILMCLIASAIIFMGKGDMLMAGYNTASKEEKEKIDVKRLRIVMGSFFLLAAGVLALRNVIGLGWFMVLLMVLIIAVLIVANTWPEKNSSFVHKEVDSSRSLSNKNDMKRQIKRQKIRQVCRW